MTSSPSVERVLQGPGRLLHHQNCPHAELMLESASLPPWEDIIVAAELYLLYCDCQPLPLFDKNSFISSLEIRDPEVLLSMLALTSRFSDDPTVRSNLTEVVNGYMEAARALVIQRLSDGPIELSTLQSLCLLSLIDFTSKFSTD